MKIASAVLCVQENAGMNPPPWRSLPEKVAKDVNFFNFSSGQAKSNYIQIVAIDRLDN